VISAWTGQAKENHLVLRMAMCRFASGDSTESGWSPASVDVASGANGAISCANLQSVATGQLKKNRPNLRKVIRESLSWEIPRSAR